MKSQHLRSFKSGKKRKRSAKMPMLRLRTTGTHSTQTPSSSAHVRIHSKSHQSASWPQLMLRMHLILVCKTLTSMTATSAALKVRFATKRVSGSISTKLCLPQTTPSHLTPRPRRHQPKAKQPTLKTPRSLLTDAPG